MASLILMYVYFDKRGDIKAITPNVDDSLASHEFTTFPLAMVEMFLTGQKNPFDFQVQKKTSITGDKFKLIKKLADIAYTRTLDSYLTKIPPSKPVDIITIVNDTIRKSVNLYIAKEFKELLENGTEDQQESIHDFMQSAPANIYITDKNNPYKMYHNITFSPAALFEKGSLHFPQEVSYNNTSAYAKKIITGYGFKERN